MASTTPPSEPSERGGSGVRGMRLPTCHKVREPCGACRPLRPALRRRCISFHDSQQPCCVGEGYDAKRAMCNPRVRCATPDHAHKSPITRAWAEPTRAWRDDHAAVLLGVCTCQHHVQRLLGVARGWARPMEPLEDERMCREPRGGMRAHLPSQRACLPTFVRRVPRAAVHSAPCFAPL